MVIRTPFQKRRLIRYSFSILLFSQLSIFVGHMATQAYIPFLQGFEAVFGTTTIVLPLTFTYFGVYLYCVFLLWLSPVKRAQAFVLSVVAIALSGSLVTFNDSMIQMRIFEPDFLLAVLSVVVGIALVGQLFPWRDRRGTASAATNLLAVMTYVALGVILIGAHVRFRDTVEFVAAGFLTDALIIGVGSYLFHMFITTSNKNEVFVLGPRRSGKTSLLAGAYAVAENDENILVEDVSEDVQETLFTLGSNSESDDSTPIGEVSGMPPTEINNVKESGFEYTLTGLFPKVVRFGQIDYAGEYVDETLASEIHHQQDGRTPRIMSSNRENSENTRSVERIYQLLAQNAINADSVIFILDPLLLGEPRTGGELPETYSLDRAEVLSTYMKIASLLQDTDLLIAITKSDLLQLNIDESSLKNPDPNAIVRELSTNRHPLFQALAQNISDDIYPVSLYMSDGEGGNSAKIQTFGIKQLLERLAN